MTGAFLYAAELECGMIKIGRSSNIDARIKALMFVCRSHFGSTINRTHKANRISYKNSLIAELDALRQAGAVCAPAPGYREFFPALGFDVAKYIIDRSTREHWSDPDEIPSEPIEVFVQRRIEFTLEKAIELSGSPTELARLLGTTRQAVHQWKLLPIHRIYQLRELKPEWFKGRK